MANLDLRFFSVLLSFGLHLCCFKPHIYFVSFLKAFQRDTAKALRRLVRVLWRY